MNKTAIEWCDQTWNPVTGCNHNCPYCYAKIYANRFGGYYDEKFWCNHYGSAEKIEVLDKPLKKQKKNGDLMNAPFPYGFAPTLHCYRLEEPQLTKKPQNIFVCSMADLFGKWVPDEWIKLVFEACEKAPQHRYLFLTKNPKRYEQFIDMPMPDNMWFGFSQTKREHIGFDTHHSWKTFVSMEPLLERLDNATPQAIDWVIIGAESGNRKGKVIPERLWIEEIVSDCRRIGTPVFMKDSLSEIWGEPLIREYPWESETVTPEAVRA
jgi:protein gp37